MYRSQVNNPLRNGFVVYLRRCSYHHEEQQHRMLHRRIQRVFESTTTATGSTSTGGSSKVTVDVAKLKQKAAYDYYKQQRESNLLYKLFHRTNNKKTKRPVNETQSDRNINTAWYMVAIAVGALGASYAAVPLYKVFCQTTGFGGTTQRILTPAEEKAQPTFDKVAQTIMKAIFVPGSSSGGSGSGGVRVHTWTDADAAQRLAKLKPVANTELITVRFDTTVSDILPWSFVPIQLDVKVVPGETALSFFRVTNHSDKAITGVATYNVYPPKVGLYFQKIQCFCFEQQRLLPGETVDMPVFFFIDPEILNDSQVSYIKSVTLSYTFFQTDEDYDIDTPDDDYDDDNDDDKEVSTKNK